MRDTPDATMANKATPDKTAKVSPGQTQGKATRSRRELKKKLKKAGHVAIAATELEKGAKDVKDRYGKTKGETLRGAQGRDKKRQTTIVPKAISTRAASNKANLVMAAKMCKDPVQMSMREVRTSEASPSI